MIICPPNATIPQQPGDDSHYVAHTRWGTQLRRESPHHFTGLRAWSKPCFWLYGRTLYAMNKTALGAQAHQWKTEAAFDHTSWNTAAATYPWTNLHNVYKTQTGYHTFIHCARAALANRWYTDYTESLQQGFLGSEYCSQSFPETDATVPAITSAAFASDGTWSMTLSNASQMFDSYDYMTLYLSTPHQSIPPIGTAFCVGPVTSDWAFSNTYNDNGDGLVSGALKPFPSGSEILMGLRGLIAGSNYYPGVLVLTNVTVD